MKKLLLIAVAAAALVTGLSMPTSSNACELRLERVYPRTVADPLYPVPCVDRLVKPASASMQAWHSHLRYVQFLNDRGYQEDHSPKYIRDAGPSSFDGGGG